MRALLLSIASSRGIGAGLALVLPMLWGLRRFGAPGRIGVG